MHPSHIKRLRPAATSPTAAPPAPDRVVSTRDLLGSGHRLWIEHATERYLLQVTRSGKLILTK